MKNALVMVGIGALVLVGGWWYLSNMNTQTAENTHQETVVTPKQVVTKKETPSASIGDENLVEFKCDGGKSITAVFTREVVGLALSDGRQIELRLYEQNGHTTMYENPDRTVQFGGEGNVAYLTEGSVHTYSSCIAQ